jgi:hypothetical protein
MARAATAKYEELVLEVEFTASSGTYTAVCGLTDVSISRVSNVDETEIPDCDDESLPLAIEKAVRSQTVTVSASGVWALSSHEQMMDWWYGGATKLVQIRNVKVVNDGSTGDTTIEGGAALLTSLNNSRTKGQKVTAEIEIQFDGVPTRTAKA